MKYAVVTAARDEAGYIEQTIDALLAQTIKPVRWVIVDDGSSDRTTSIVQAAAQNFPWITAIRRADRGYRSVGVGNYDALQEGFRALENEDYDFLCIIDADIDFQPNYFATLEKKFAADTQLGIGCGAVWDILNGNSYRVDILPEMTGGPLKCYRRACFEAIGGLVRGASWDAIDCFKAMQLGWISQTFDDRELRITHLRPTGSTQKGIFVGKERRGAGMYFMGAHPLWVIASALRRLLEPPIVLGSLFILWGYFSEMARRGKQVQDAELIQFTRKWQLKKLRSKLNIAKAKTIRATSAAILFVDSLLR